MQARAEPRNREVEGDNSTGIASGNGKGAAQAICNYCAMQIVAAMRIPSAGGGVRTHVATVSDQMQRTGHDVHVFSRDTGDWREPFESAGLRTAATAAELPEAPDVVIAHDLPSAYDMLELRPDVPQVFVCHGQLYDVDFPPQLEGAVGLLVALYSGAGARTNAAAVKTPTVALRQPIHVHRFTPTRPINDVPRRAVAISNYLVGERREILIEACEKAGIELELYGVNEPGGVAERPEDVMNGADIVFGKARVIMEAMACGRAAYVFDVFGCDGWVTPEKLPAMLDSGIAGSSTTQTADADAIAADLANYTASMGMVNRDLALASFSVTKHVATLIRAIEEMLEEPPAMNNDAAFELARLSRISWGFEGETHVLRHRLVVAEHRVNEIERLRAELDDTHARLAAVEGSARWKAVQRVLLPFDRVRGRR